jgi:hypothetical protein
MLLFNATTEYCQEQTNRHDSFDLVPVLLRLPVIVEVFKNVLHPTAKKGSGGKFARMVGNGKVGGPLCFSI